MSSRSSRFWSLVGKAAEPNGCWEWLLYKTQKGYGQYQWDGRLELTHRLAWILERGPIPIGMQVCHKCDNPSCVRPGHLFLGTAKDNTADMIKKGRSYFPGPTNPATGKNHGRGSAKLTADQVREIRAIRDVQYKEIAKQYNVHPSQISRIMNNLKWVEGTF